MQQTVKLVCFRDEMTGELGLSLSDMPRNENTNAAYSGVLLAHDIIEHINGAENIGSIDDELEALGAVWFVRGQFGELTKSGRSYYTPHQNLASDVTRMFVDFAHGAAVNLAFSFDSEETPDADFEDILQHAREDIPKELDSEDDEFLRDNLESYLAVCVARMRQGYIKAQNRYSSATYANSLFWAIESAVNPYCKGAEYEGQEYELTFGVRDNGGVFAYCEEFYNFDSED